MSKKKYYGLFDSFFRTNFEKAKNIVFFYGNCFYYLNLINFFLCFVCFSKKKEKKKRNQTGSLFSLFLRKENNFRKQDTYR